MNYKEENGIAIINIDKDINSTNIDDFRKILDEIKEKDILKIIFDFHNIDFVLSEVFGLLIATLKRVRISEGDIIICGVSNKLMRIFQITRLDKVIDIVDNVNSAKKRL